MPYNPGIQSHADSIITQSLGAAQQNTNMLVSWLTNFLDQQKQINNAGKSADYYVKANPKALDTMGIHPEEWSNLGAKDKALAVQTMMQTQAQQAQQAKVENMQAATQLNQARTKEMTSQAAAGDVFKTAVQRATQPNAGAGELNANDLFQQLADPRLKNAMRSLAMGRTVGPEELANMGIEAGVDPQKVGVLADSLARIRRYGNEGDGNLSTTFSKAPSGQWFAERGRQLLPAGVDAEMARAAAVPQPQHDDTGNLIGWTETDVKGRSSFHAFKGGNKLPPALDADGQPINGFYISPEGRILDSRTAIQKMTGTGTAGTTATPVTGAPKAGDIVKGYRFKGGDPKDKNNWTKVQ
jgi:hypothetical protein